MKNTLTATTKMMVIPVMTMTTKKTMMLRYIIGENVRNPISQISHTICQFSAQRIFLTANPTSHLLRKIGGKNGKFQGKAKSKFSNWQNCKYCLFVCKDLLAQKFIMWQMVQWHLHISVVIDVFIWGKGQSRLSEFTQISFFYRTQVRS